jgi:hypothetical protein
MTDRRSQGKPDDIQPFAKEAYFPFFRQPRGPIARVREDSNELFIVYLGTHRGIMINPAIFLSETGLLHRNLLILHDPWRVFYQCGISLEVDSFDALLEWQRRYVLRLRHVERIFCVGVSAGGYAALAFGHLLAVEEVWAFAPLTVLPTLTHVQMQREAANRSRSFVNGGVAAGAGSLVVPEIPADRADLELKLKRSNGVTRYNIFYNDSCSFDAESASHVAACDNVHLFPQSGKAVHNVVETLFEQERLSTIVVPHRPRGNV